MSLPPDPQLRHALADAAREVSAVRAAAEVIALRELGAAAAEIAVLLSLLESCAKALETLDRVIRRQAEGEENGDAA
jgi:hypothetical protein